MSTVIDECSLPSAARLEQSGLFRGTLAGRGCTLEDAFSNLERQPGAHRVSRHGRRNLFGARIPLDPSDGVGHWEFTRIGSGAYVVIENFKYNHPRVEFVPGDDLIQFYFKLSGDLTMRLNEAQQPLRINRPSLLIYQQPRGIDIDEWVAASAQERCVAISMSRDFLIEEFFTSTGAPPSLLEAFMAGTLAEIQYQQVPLSAQMFELVTRLVDNPYSAALRLIYTEAVTFELLCLALSGLDAFKGAQLYDCYSQRDLRSLHLARSVLMKELSPPPTIAQLARMAGLSETVLKKGFKDLFGETIFDFSVRCRMEQAMKLLTERELQISRIAEAVGYSHQTTFATAFRRHFGMRPKDARTPIAH